MKGYLWYGIWKRLFGLREFLERSFGDLTSSCKGLQTTMSVACFAALILKHIWSKFSWAQHKHVAHCNIVLCKSVHERCSFGTFFRKKYSCKQKNENHVNRQQYYFTSDDLRKKMTRSCVWFRSVFELAERLLALKQIYFLREFISV